MSDHWRIRRMQLDDVPRIMLIENKENEFPWRESTFVRSLESYHYAIVTETVATHELLGYTLMSRSSQEAHVLNICVASQHRGQGLGRAMLENLIHTAKLLGDHKIYLELRVSNHIAYHLYWRLGFVPAGQRKAYYPDHDAREDAYVMELTLHPHHQDPESF